MAFYIHSDILDCEETLALDAAGKGECIALWTTAGSWSSDKKTGGVVPSGVVRMLGRPGSHADELVRVGLWDKQPNGYEFKGASGAYASAMASHKRPKPYVVLKYCKLPSKAFIDWHKARGLKKNRSLTQSLRAEVIATHGMVCWLCGDAIETVSDLHLDHVQPRALNGEETADNLRPAHSRCNIIRGTKTPDEARRAIAFDRGGR